jgi:hypothetical protein
MLYIPCDIKTNICEYMGNVISLYLTCKALKKYLDYKLVLKQNCPCHGVRMYSLNNSFCCISKRKSNDFQCKLLPEEFNMVSIKKYVDIIGILRTNDLVDIIKWTIVHSTDNTVDPIIHYLESKSPSTYDYIREYAILAFKQKNYVLADHFIDKYRKFDPFIRGILIQVCKDDMIDMFKILKDDCKKCNSYCLNKSLKYNSKKIINYIIENFLSKEWLKGPEYTKFIEKYGYEYPYIVKYLNNV